MTKNFHIFDRLFAAIRAKRRGDPETSYTAHLFAGGMPKIAQKVGEEAVELAIAAVQGKKAPIAEESADLLYHLFVLWAASGVTLEQIGRVLEKRFGQSGIAEKAARKKSPPP